jgi:hypothetical protein
MRYLYLKNAPNRISCMDYRNIGNSRDAGITLTAFLRSAISGFTKTFLISHSDVHLLCFYVLMPFKAVNSRFQQLRLIQIPSQECSFPLLVLVTKIPVSTDLNSTPFLSVLKDCRSVCKSPIWKRVKRIPCPNE